MNLATMRYHSSSLGRHVTYAALLPEPDAGPGPFPVLYQLHGASDDYSAWLIFSNLQRHASGLPLIVVLPDGALSWWRNAGVRDRYEDYVVSDLPRHVAATFHVRPGRHAIGGLSMGGFGAVLLGLKHPDLFASIWAHSSVMPTLEAMRHRELPGSVEADDIYRLAARVAALPEAERPRLSFDCGVEDHLLEDNRAFHRHLDAIGLPHAYHEHPGAHRWSYWDEHVQEALQQHADVLDVRRR